MFDINWVDVLIVLFLARAFYVGFKDGLSLEVLRFIKNIAVLCVGLHFYQTLGKGLKIHSIVSIELASAVAYILIVIGLYLGFYFIEKFIKVLVEFTFIDWLEKYGGLFCAAFRSFIASVTVIILFSLIPVRFVVKQTAASCWIGSLVVDTIPRYYDKYIESYFEEKSFKVEDYYDYLEDYLPEDQKKRSAKRANKFGLKTFKKTLKERKKKITQK